MCNDLVYDQAKLANARRIRRIHPRLSRSMSCRRGGIVPLRPRRFDFPRRKEEREAGDQPEIPPPPPVVCPTVTRGAPQLHATGLRRWTRSLHSPASTPDVRRAAEERNPLPPTPVVSRPSFRAHQSPGLINQRNKYLPMRDAATGRSIRSIDRCLVARRTLHAALFPPFR